MRLCQIRDLFFVSLAIVASAMCSLAQSSQAPAVPVPTVPGPAAPAPAASGTRALTFLDMMKFRQIKSPVLASTGTAVAYQSQPDRGDGEVIVYDLEQKREHRIARGQRPVFSEDGKWVAVLVAPPVFAATEPKPKQALVLLDLKTGRQVVHERVQSVVFSKDSAWVAFRHHKPVKKDEGNDEGKNTGKDKGLAKDKTASATPKPNKKRDAGTELKFWRLGTPSAITATEHAVRFGFSPDSHNLYYAVAEPTGVNNGLYRRNLDNHPDQQRTVMARANHVVTAMAWTESGDQLAAADAPQDDLGDMGDGTIYLIKADKASRIAWTGVTGEQWVMPSAPELRWSKTGHRLFTGFWHRDMANKVRALAAHKRAADDRVKTGKKLAADVIPGDAFDLEALVDERKLDIWHTDDPQISTEQKARWQRDSKQTYAAVWHGDTETLVQLADRKMQSVRVPEGSLFGVGSDRARYATETTWDGRYEDLYIVDIKTAERRLVQSHVGSGPATLGPKGRRLLYWHDGYWNVFDNKAGTNTVLSDIPSAAFANEDHDYPSDVPSYGTAGWQANGSAVYVYDKYDIWEFSFDAEGDIYIMPLMQLEGRATQRTFRIVDMDPDDPFVDLSKPSLLSVSHAQQKYRGLCMFVDGKAESLVEEAANYTVLADSDDGDRVLFTRQTYRDFPDLWVGDFKLGNSVQVSHLGEQTEPFAWGTAELVDWQSLDGKPLQGVLIKPDDYEEGKRYPVLVYYYRFFSQRLHDFNQVVVNHRPCFPYYASNGYCVFLPDIRFDVGNPGYAATKCLVPGVQKLIDMGVAKPDGIGLHGHSWSGYQTAFVITQTNRFACAVAGAPVTNMTSAYGGIRWESGMSRQFQYEKTQSRIGGSLWAARDLYIENSPVFFADRIQTPLLIQFGDQDGAVPWTQGIELYMAMRRLQKPCVFLQYRGEPHHLKQYANKLDYSMRMKQWLDHFCIGGPAPQWITSGEPYRGR
ncbi:MAG: dipeptidyl aminopeptidase/acylaminoacyl peptidase [Planctomycetota bacterium]|jgi:dipeptidyl aminopeptidase/acylaminoacyl peptidase